MLSQQHRIREPCDLTLQDMLHEIRNALQPLGVGIKSESADLLDGSVFKQLQLSNGQSLAFRAPSSDGRVHYTGDVQIWQQPHLVETTRVTCAQDLQGFVRRYVVQPAALDALRARLTMQAALLVEGTLRTLEASEEDAEQWLTRVQLRQLCVESMGLALQQRRDG
jgi:hypothetical protein